jgi:hypothetical protein
LSPLTRLIQAGDYVAQRIVLPGERLLDKLDPKAMKFDLRAFSSDGAVPTGSALRNMSG